MRTISAGLSTAAFTTLIGCSTALAADADAFAERLKQALTQQGAAMDYSEAMSEGDNVIVKGVTFGNGEGKTNLGDLTFENVSGSTESGWTAERLPLADVEGSDDVEDSDKPLNYAFRDMSIENIQIVGTAPSADVPAVFQAAVILYDKASIGSIELSDGTSTVVSLDDAVSTNTLSDDGSFTGDLAIANFTVNVPEESEDGSAESVRELGYEQFNGSMNGKVSWSIDDGTLSLSPLAFDVEDVGTLDMSYAIGGYTPQLIQSLQQMSQQMEQNPEDNQNAGMAMMGIMAQLTIDGISLSFKDDSLTERLLEYYAKQMSQTPEDVINLAVQIVQGSIASIGDQAFQSQVTDAVRSFLEDPTSIRVASEPEQPIPVMQVVGAAMGAPQSIPNVLQLRVQANAAGPADAGGAKATEGSQDAQDMQTTPDGQGTGSAQ